MESRDRICSLVEVATLKVFVEGAICCCGSKKTKDRLDDLIRAAEGAGGKRWEAEAAKRYQERLSAHSSAYLESLEDSSSRDKAD